MSKNVFKFSGKLAVFNSYSDYVYLDIASQIDQEAGVESIVIGKSYVMTYEVKSFPGLKVNSAITINGSAFTIRDYRLIDDGLFAKAYLSEAS